MRTFVKISTTEALVDIFNLIFNIKDWRIVVSNSIVLGDLLEDFNTLIKTISTIEIARRLYDEEGEKCCDEVKSSCKPE